ncbi:MAG: type II toxin-antitoxin system RelE/ParE family toxin [Rickettsiales bacterium]|nr:type II toxin-antitoxin system RelE/ParE family toxin [Rickettsiales bacterium]
MQNQLTLLAYLYNTNEKIIILLAFGTHKNFCPNSKRK